MKAGVVITTIEPDTPAYKSDLRPADVITAIDGIPVATAQELRHQVLSKKIGQTVTHRVTLRWRAGLTTKQRLRRGSQIFLIRGVQDPDDRRRRLICTCEEIKP